MGAETKHTQQQLLTLQKKNTNSPMIFNSLFFKNSNEDPATNRPTWSLVMNALLLRTQQIFNGKLTGI